MKVQSKLIGSFVLALLISSVMMVGCTPEEPAAPKPEVSPEAASRLQPQSTPGAETGGSAENAGPQAPPPADGN